jgi:hypothetical protein
MHLASVANRGMTRRIEMHIKSGGKSIFANAPRRWAARQVLGFVLGGALLAGSSFAAAQTLVFDRGLPTQNLNLAAGANRANIEWADIETPPQTPWLPGDDFTLTGTGSYVLTKIRVWSTDSTGLILHGGIAGAPIGVISNNYTATQVTYANTESYQTSAGPFLPLYQIDFAVDIPLDGGVTYQYFLDGPATPSGTDFAGVHLHASNAALSAATQMGADGTFLFLGNDGTVYTWNSFSGAGTYCGCSGWDKTSDGDVQVFGNIVAPKSQILVFDRGLPTQNFNLAAGASRSNIEWADIETPPIGPWLPGDDFTLSASQDFYDIATIRVWSTDSTDLDLRGGVAGGPISVIPNTYTAIPVTYANNETYQNSAGTFLPLYQIDFSVHIPLGAGVKYQFFLDGPSTPVGTDFAGVHLHASNAARSGSSQTGADDTFLFLGNHATVYTWNSQTGAGTYCPGCSGWDKPSDGNVQVFISDSIFANGFEFGE